MVWGPEVLEINAAQAPERACEDELAAPETAEVNPGGADASKLYQWI